MITIDIIDENNERSAKTVVQAYPVAGNQQHTSFDAAYESARNIYADLLCVAEQERQARQAMSSSGSDVARKQDVIIALTRIARALTAWL